MATNPPSPWHKQAESQENNAPCLDKAAPVRGNLPSSPLVIPPPNARPVPPMGGRDGHEVTPMGGEGGLHRKTVP